MRRLLGGAALGMLLAVSVTGCGPKAGATGAAPSSPEAKPFVPEVDACHLVAEPVGYRSSYAPVDCAKTHRAETIHVGTFTGPDAARVTPPPAGSPELRAAFRVCDAEATKFVGADWRGGLMSVKVVTPGPQDWTAGSHWYRCDLYVLPSLDGGSARHHPDDQATERTGSLRGEFTRPSPLAYGCYNEDRYEDLQPVSCTKPHRIEYVGIWTAPDGTYAAADRDPKPVHGHCRDVIATAIKGAAKAKLPQGGTMFRMPSPEAWERGDRGIRCFYWSDDRDMTRSLKS
jgi:hypothetical protein